MAQATQQRGKPAAGAQAKEVDLGSADDTGANIGESAVGDVADMVDLSQTEEGGNFPLVPKGMHVCVIDDVSFGDSKAGNPMWTVQWSIEEGENANQKLWSWVVFKADQMGRVKRFLNRIGRTDLANGKFSPAQVADSGELVGVRAKLRVDHRDYEGEKRANVRDVLQAPAPGQDSGDFLSSVGGR
jgi:hypothetical protein